MSGLLGFVAYPSRPPQIGQAIKAALDRLQTTNHHVALSTWEENDVAGRFIAAPILAEIDAGDILVADITQLNFNVVFEVGYAIGRRKRAYLIRNFAIVGSDDLIREVGIFDTLGYQRYDSSEQLSSHLSGLSSTAPLAVRDKVPNRPAPVYLVLPRFKDVNETRTSSRLKKARLQFRSFDPEEHGRLPAGGGYRPRRAVAGCSYLAPTVRAEGRPGA